MFEVACYWIEHYFQTGISLNQITPLNRLAYVGSGGMSALTYKPSLNAKV
jgi:hypothetical protein